MKLRPADFLPYVGQDVLVQSRRSGKYYRVCVVQFEPPGVMRLIGHQWRCKSNLFRGEIFGAQRVMYPESITHFVPIPEEWPLPQHSHIMKSA